MTVVCQGRASADPGALALVHGGEVPGADGGPDPGGPAGLQSELQGRAAGRGAGSGQREQQREFSRSQSARLSAFCCSSSSLSVCLSSLSRIVSPPQESKQFLQYVTE